MKYCHFCHLNILLWASMLARCMYDNWRSRARGVAKHKTVILVLGRKHYFVWSPYCVGMPLLLFWTPLLRECLKTCFPESLHMNHLFVWFCLSRTWRAAVLFLGWLRKCDSLPAWESQFGCQRSVGEFLRCEQLDVTLNNVLPALRGDQNFWCQCVISEWLWRDGLEISLGCHWKH